MQRKMSWLGSLIVLAFVVILPAALGNDIPWGEEKTDSALPRIFTENPQQRLAAEEVARQDAYRKLLERIYGFYLTGDTNVHDLAMASRRLDTALRGTLKGMREVDKKYFPDGRVEIAVKITLRRIVEVIETTYKEVEEDNRLVSREVFEDIRREHRDKDIIAVGRGAMPGSEGLKRIRAMRAAEVDCYERIGRRVFGLDITADTQVLDFALQSDSIQSRIARELPGGISFTSYQFSDDGTASATGEITIRRIVEIMERTYRRHEENSRLVSLEEIRNLERKHRDLVIEEVGHGVVREFQERGLSATPEPYQEEKTVTKVIRTMRRERVVDEQIGVED